MAQDAAASPVPSPAPAKGQSHKAPPQGAVDPRGPVLAFATMVAAALFTAASTPASSASSIPWTLNPTGHLTFGVYVLLYIVSIPAKEVLDWFLNGLARHIFHLPRMDEGEAKVKKLEVLERIDLCYLSLNTLIEFVGMNHVIGFIIGSRVEQHLGGITVLSGPVAFVLIMTLNDIIYYPWHLIAHRREFYGYVHKQHHRQFLPFRGYADAGNQHPIEQMSGFSIFILCMFVASKTVGLHAACAWCAFLTWAIFNVMNHLAFNSWLHVPMLYPAYPRDHQMHHRFPQCNYNTLSSMCDRLFGTFRPYQPLALSAGPSATKADAVAGAELRPCRPEALPAPASVLSLALGLAFFGLTVEAVRTGAIPQLAAAAQLMPVLAAVGVTALFVGLAGRKTP